MSLIDQIEANLIPAVSALKPKVVLTAPDGQRLYIDVAPSASSGAASSTPLWPAGFSVSLATGDLPANDPTITDSPGEFFAEQSPVILAAPGPLGFPWWVWLTFFILLALAPFGLMYFRKR